MRPLRFWTALALVILCAVGVLIGQALVSPRTNPNGPGADFYRCWGWYEGTYGGRQGARCPDWWPAEHP